MKAVISILARTKAFFILLVMLSAFSCGDFGKCKEQDPNFRPHKLRYCNKSKIYWYYHNTPCDCNGIYNDLELDTHFGKEYRNYVEYYDDGEIVWGR